LTLKFWRSRFSRSFAGATPIDLCLVPAMNRVVEIDAEARGFLVSIRRETGMNSMRLPIWIRIVVVAALAILAVGTTLLAYR
jgi:hypothetical protein